MVIRSLTIRQPDGTLAQLPIWMTEDRRSDDVTEVPRLALACLRELRLEFDACPNFCTTIPVAKERQA